MTLSFTRLSKTPNTFKALRGLKVSEFQKVIREIRRDWEELESKKKAEGRPCVLMTLEDKVLCIFIYYRTYITHTFLGYLFNLHNSNICRLFKKLEPLLAKRLPIKKDRSLTHEGILKILADVTEQPIQRPKVYSKQKRSYSGKKKAHTLKTEIILEEKGRILSVFKSYKGRTHDFKIRKQERILPPKAIKYGDSGYQGLQKIQSHVVIPYKKERKKPLTIEQKKHNRELASFRMRVENKIRELKIFKILSYTYRNFQKKYHIRFNIIAGLVNLKHGF